MTRKIKQSGPIYPKKIMKLNHIRFIVLVTLLIIITTAFTMLTNISRTMAEITIPPTWDVINDDFESGTLAKWQLSSPNYPVIASGYGYNSTSALSVDVNSDTSFIYQSHIAKAEEGYISFWFNPNGVSIPDQGPNWIPGKSLSIAKVVNSNDWQPPLISLYIRRPAGQDYQAYLAWPINTSDEMYYDYDNAFPIIDGWQQITIGYRINEWVAVWCNGELMRYVTNVVHTDPYGDIVYIGKLNTTSNDSSGNLHFDQVAFQIPILENLWVDANNGEDNNDGLTSDTALRTIQRAGDLAGPGTTVHILPGVYRETVDPLFNGTEAEPIHYVAEDGSGTVAIRGSEPSSTLLWTQLTTDTIGLPPGVDPTNVYSADLSNWNLNGPPRFVIELDGSGQVTARLPLAREPDWGVVTDWKYQEYWWAADGGTSPATCDPATDPNRDCDLNSRSTTQLTDRTNDTDPPGVEPGNLTTLGDLTGATLVALDTYQGHYLYRRTIIADDINAGRITVNRSCDYDSPGNPGLGWGSKYYVEGKPNLLDSPGEWWYDTNTKQIYLWPRTAGNPADMNIEISQLDNGFNLQNHSYITLDGLTIENFNGSAVYEVNGITDKSYGNTLRNLTLWYAEVGVNIKQEVSGTEPIDNVIDGFVVENSEIAHMDSLGIQLLDWWEGAPNPDFFTHSGVLNTTINNNDLHDLGFRTDSDYPVGNLISFANKLRFENNHVHNIAHNGVQFSWSVIQSTKEFGFDPSEIKTGDILVKDNLFEQTCQLATDCGGLKIWGSPPDNHVFRNFLVTGNVFRDIFGWTYVAEKRGRWTGGESSEVRGMGGFGLYVDHASGIHAYRNISYNIAFTGFVIYDKWRDGQMVYVNNIAANSLYGIRLGEEEPGTHESVDTQVINNIVVNNEGFGLWLRYTEGQTANMIVDHNLYYDNGWRSWDQGGIYHAGVMLVENGSWTPYQTLAEVHANTSWEDLGVEGDPAFLEYNPADHDIHDGSWPNFHLTGVSTNAIDKGTTALPASLTALLNEFEVEDYQVGAAYDIGRYEDGFILLAAPISQAISPNGTAYYTLRLFPADIPYTVTLSTDNPSPYLIFNLSPFVITGDQVAILTVTDTHPSPQIPGLSYVLPITGRSGGFTNTASLGLMVGGTRIYLPVVRK